MFVANNWLIKNEFFGVRLNIFKNSNAVCKILKKLSTTFSGNLFLSIVVINGKIRNNLKKQLYAQNASTIFF